MCDKMMFMLPDVQMMMRDLDTMDSCHVQTTELTWKSRLFANITNPNKKPTNRLRQSIEQVFNNGKSISQVRKQVYESLNNCTYQITRPAVTVQVSSNNKRKSTDSWGSLDLQNFQNDLTIRSPSYDSVESDVELPIDYDVELEEQEYYESMRKRRSIEYANEQPHYSEFVDVMIM